MSPAEGQPGQQIPIGTVPNFRDLGGWSTPTGRVRSGMLFRSAEFANLAGDDLTAFDRFGIRSVYDLRTADERAANPNTLPDGVEYVVLDILADATGAGPAQVLQALADADTAKETLGDGKAVAMFEQAYRQIVSLPSALAGYKQFFLDVADSGHRPAVFHCTTGKDRTGWAAIAFLSLLGVSKDDIRKDYLLTNDQLLPSLKPFLDQIAAKGIDTSLLQPVVGVQGEYFDAALDEMTKRYGTIEGYFTDGLGLDEATMATIRSDYTEKA
jgi:protein-tyrosine phosphatase